MALAIDYNGYGVVANADRETNDTGGSATGDWSELGGGTIGFNPDVYLYTGGIDGAGSMGGKYTAAKSGYNYIDGITALDLDVAGAQEGEFIYCWINIQSAGAFNTLANDGFSVVVGTSDSANSHWRIAGNDGANGWTGGWKLFVIDPTITAGVITDGTLSLNSIAMLGIWINATVSVRADSIFQSQIICAKGLFITGTPTIAGNGLDEIVSWATDLPNRAAGIFQKRGNTYYSLGSLTVGDDSTLTTLSAYGNNIEYEESSYWNGSAWVTSYSTTANNIITTLNASIDFVNTGVSGLISNKLSIDTSVGNASSFVGGYLKLMYSILVKSTDVFNGVVFGDNDALSLGSASYDNCSFNTSGTVTIDTTTSSFSGNTLNPNTGITALTTSSLNYAETCTFNSGGTGNAVEFTGLANSYTWDNILSGYDVGSVGDGVEITGGSITGDEAIHITATTGTFEISVADTGTVPSVSTAGAVVNVLAGQVTLLVKVVDDTTGLPLTDARVNIVDNATKTEILNAECDINGEASASLTYTADKDVVGWVREMSLTGTDYTPKDVSGTITSSGLTISVRLQPI